MQGVVLVRSSSGGLFAWVLGLLKYWTVPARVLTNVSPSLIFRNKNRHEFNVSPSLPASIFRAIRGLQGGDR